MATWKNKYFQFIIPSCHPIEVEVVKMIGLTYFFIGIPPGKTSPMFHSSNGVSSDCPRKINEKIKIKLTTKSKWIKEKK